MNGEEALELISERDCWPDYNIVRPGDHVQPPEVKLEAGQQYAMRVDGPRSVRVLLVKEPWVTKRGDLRAMVVVMEANPYVLAGGFCMPFAFTLGPLR